MRTYERLGVTVTAILVGSLLILAIGFWQNWFTFSMEEGSGDKAVDLTFSVHPSAIQRDAREVGRQVSQAEQHMEAIAEVQSAEGVVTQVEATGLTLAIRSGDSSLTFQLAESAEIRVKDQAATLSQLRVGDQITVVYRVRDNTNIAEKVTVL